MNNSTATGNTSIPITKMVNDLFLQWLSLSDTRTILYGALQSARTNSKMPDLVAYPKTYTTRGGGFSKPQHFDSPPVSPVPRTASSPRSGLSSIPSTGEFTPGLSGNSDERKQRSLKKKYPVVNGSPASSTITNSNIDQQQVSGGKASPSQIVKSEPLPSSSPSITSALPTRLSITAAAETTQSNGTTSKQTPVIQARLQSPPPIVRDLSPPPTSPKSTSVGVASLREHFDIVEQSPSITKPKTPSRAKSPVSSVPTDNLQRQPSKTATTPVKEVSPIPISVVKSEEKSETVEPIPKFYFPNGQISTPSAIDILLTRQLRQVKEDLFVPKHDKLHLEDFGKLAQLLDLSLYWKTPLFRACVHDTLGPKVNITSHTTVSYLQFESFWKKLCKNHHDHASKFIHLLVVSSPSLAALPVNRQYLTVDDWDYLVQDIIDTHPGLKFLREAREFHSRYIKTVVARVYYNCNRSWSGKLTVQELRRSNFLSTLDRIEEEEDINRIHDYFSYEHFYVIYCKFWELDSDHDLLISRDDLAKHNNGAISNKMIDRIFSGAISNSQNMREGKMSYYEFVWFLISEEDKRSPTSIEYWFRCMDLDGDGILSMFELDYFYQEQVHKMEIYGIEYMPFEDCICQMLDLVKPEEENKIRLKDLKRCKLTNVFFDTFFNLEKYLDNEQKDPFSNVKDPDSPEISDWVKFAEAEYDNLTHEDGANENLDEVNYDDDFEEDEEGAGGPSTEPSTNKRIGLGGGSASNAISPPQRIGTNIKTNDMDERWKD